MEESNLLIKNVEECPPPPGYYKLFDSNSNIPIQPPAICLSDLEVYNSLYNGVLPKNKEKSFQPPLVEKDYKQIMKS